MPFLSQDLKVVGVIPSIEAASLVLISFDCFIELFISFDNG